MAVGLAFSGPGKGEEGIEATPNRQGDVADAEPPQQAQVPDPIAIEREAAIELLERQREEAKRRESEAALKVAEAARLRREDEQRRAEQRQARRQQIREELDALPESEKREREAVEGRIALYEQHIAEVTQYLAALKSDIQGLQLDAALGQAFGTGRSNRQDMLRIKTDEYDKWQKDLGQAQAALRQAQQELRDLAVRYRRDMTRLLAELTELNDSR